MSIFLSSTFLGLNPIIMRKLQKILKITDSGIIAYSALILYIGKTSVTGVIDLFCQGLIIGNNISAKENLEILDLVYIVTSTMVTLILSFFIC